MTRLTTARRATLGLVAAFLLQAGLLGWIVVDRALLLARGAEIRLAVRPVDPRDLVRGEYVTLVYDISTLDPAALAPGDARIEAVEADDRVYVSLENAGGNPESAGGNPTSAGGTLPSAGGKVSSAGGGWRATGLGTAPPREGLYLRGRVTRVDGTGAARRLHVAYDLEQFFMPEGQAIEIERLRNARRVEVDVAVGTGGRAALRRLVIDGALRYEDPLF